MSQNANENKSGANDTPIMKQYLAAKARYPRHLLFFRIGDFFELFYDDAKTIARVLGLTLTSRNKGADPIPMAGVPAHTAEQYLARLLRMGFSVAVCDQTQDSAEAKGLVRREVTRVVTPGTVLEDNLLEAKKANRLAAILPATHAPDALCGASRSGGGAVRFGLASVDLASGCIYVQELEGEAALRSEFARLAPSEVLLPEDPLLPNGQTAPLPFHESLLGNVALSRLKPAAFSAREAHANVVARFSESGRDTARAAALKKLAKELPLALAAAGALSGYIDETHPGGKVLLSPPQPFDPEYFLMLGDAVIRSLELIETLRNRSVEGSLLWAIDRTCTAPGSRCLREWMIRPLRELKTLNARQDAVAALVERTELRDELRELLKALADLERIAARLSANRATPRDLIALKDTLNRAPQLHDKLSSIDTTPLLEAGSEGAAKPDAVPPSPPKREGGEGPGVRGCPAVLEAIRDTLTGFEPVAQYIAQTLRDDCSNLVHEGGLIKSGVDAELDRLHAISSGGKDWIANFEAQEAERTGIASLKVGYNRVFGYYIEISKANAKMAPQDYERRQTLTNAERYTTPALKEHEAEVLGADDKIRSLEQKLFAALREYVAESAPRLLTAGHALAELDALSSLAEVAHKRGHVRPALSNAGRLSFEQMRHPVLEETLPRGELVPNDLALNAPVRREGSNAPAGNAEKDAAKRDPQIVLLTGPNMAGKSTYIRATALCVILAQMGGFVPAEAADVGLVDRIFTRVGAADDLAGGRSTFMVEMTEVAEILSACTSRSLVILDEVGRGTSTYDGVSLAWALVEHLHEGGAAPRTLFATHYHELSALEEELPRVRNASAAVKEWQGEITFLHRIVPGPSERSFGIHAARLAGLPEKLLERARAILRSLEFESSHRLENLTDDGAQLLSGGDGHSKSKRRKRAPTKTDGQLQLFEPEAEDIDAEVKALLDELRTLSPETLTPLQALAALDTLARKARGM